LTTKISQTFPINLVQVRSKS